MRFLFVDRILQLSSTTGSVCGIKHITPDEFYLYIDETSGRSCFMSALIGETLGQMTAWAVMAKMDFRLRPVAGVVSSVEMLRVAYVGETLELESWIDALDDTAVQYHGEVRVGSEVVFRLEGALGPMLPMEDFIDPAVVRRQFIEIDRPGVWPPVLSQASILPLAKPKQLSALQFDDVTAHEPGVRISAVKHVTRAAPYFPDHFPHKPVLPLTVLLECTTNLVKAFLAQAGLSDAYQIRSLCKIKMSDFVYPGDVVHCDVTVKSQDPQALTLRCTATVAGKRVCGLEINCVGVQG
ncbi:MAG: hydroxymyristoyl-ACP dehydratase [Legionellales bacterium]|nr:hydroxymyristoyl-ACP dehydratase [Legionellales bacterium]